MIINPFWAGVVATLLFEWAISNIANLMGWQDRKKK